MTFNPLFDIIYLYLIRGFILKMVSNYTIKIVEINNSPVKSDTSFDLNELIERTNNGDNNLINDLFMATKVAICEYHTNNGSHRFYKRYCITKQNGELLINQNLTQKTYSFNNNSLVDILVVYHNKTSNQTQKQKVSLAEIYNLYNKITNQESDNESTN